MVAVMKVVVVVVTKHLVACYDTCSIFTKSVDRRYMI